MLPPVLVSCPGNCFEHQKTLYVTQELGAGVWGDSALGKYTEDSLVCLAAKQATGIDGGTYLLRIEYQNQKKGFVGHNVHGVQSLPLRVDEVEKMPKGEIGRTFHVSVAKDIHIEKGKDGHITPHSLEQFERHPVARVLGLMASNPDEVDANHDQKITQDEYLAWAQAMMKKAAHSRRRLASQGLAEEAELMGAR